MRYLWIKMFRDLKQHFTQFVAVFLMATVSVLIFSGMASVWTGLNHVVQHETASTHMADYYVKAMAITENDRNALTKIDGISKLSLTTDYTFSTSDGLSEINISTADNDDVSAFTLIKGQPYDDQAEGIYLDRDYAEAHHLQVGDTLTMDGLIAKNIKLKILGIVHSPEYIYFTGAITETVPNYEKFGYGFVNQKTFKKLVPKLQYTTAKIKGAVPYDEKAIQQIFGDRLLYIQERSDFTAYARAEKEAAQMQKMATLFSAVFILLSLLTMYTSMIRLVDRQTELIGTMKGLGVSTTKILFHYALYGFFVPLLGGVTGLIVGRFTVSKALMKVKQTTLHLTNWELIHSKMSFALIGVILLCCVLASVLAAGKVLKGKPADIMRGNTGKQKQRKALKASDLTNKVSYEWKLALRNMKENRVRFTMGIIGVLGGMILMIAGFGVSNAIHSSNDFVFQKQFTYEVKGVLSRPGVLLKNDEDIQYLYESNLELKTAHEVKQTLLTALDEGNYYHFYNDDDEEIKLPTEGALLSRHLASELGIKEGDVVKIRIFGTNTWETLKISGLTKTLTPQGVFMSKEALSHIGTAFKATSFVTDNKDAQYFSAMDNVKNVITRDEQLKNTETVADSVMSIVKLLIMASVVLSIVILYNLGILNYVERVREYATMKVLGFYQREIRRIAILECLVTTAIGWLLGIPIGRLFLKVYVKIVSFDTFEWIAAVNLKTYVIASVVIVGVSIIVNLILANKVKKIVMVEALKSVE